MLWSCQARNGLELVDKRLFTLVCRDDAAVTLRGEKRVEKRGDCEGRCSGTVSFHGQDIGATGDVPEIEFLWMSRCCGGHRDEPMVTVVTQT